MLRKCYENVTLFGRLLYQLDLEMEMAKNLFNFVEFISRQLM